MKCNFSSALVFFFPPLLGICSTYEFIRIYLQIVFESGFCLSLTFFCWRLRRRATKEKTKVLEINWINDIIHWKCILWPRAVSFSPDTASDLQIISHRTRVLLRHIFPSLVEMNVWKTMPRKVAAPRELLLGVATTPPTTVAPRAPTQSQSQSGEYGARALVGIFYSVYSGSVCNNKFGSIFQRCWCAYNLEKGKINDEKKRRRVGLNGDGCLHLHEYAIRMRWMWRWTTSGALHISETMYAIGILVQLVAYSPFTFAPILY